MYKKAMTGLMMINIMILFGFLTVKGIGDGVDISKPAYEAELDERYTTEAGKNAMGIVSVAASGQRIVDYQTLNKEWKYELSKEELEVLLRIVEAEAGGEDEEGKLLVANVVLNRVASEDFPDTISEVVFQRENGVHEFFTSPN